MKYVYILASKAKEEFRMCFCWVFPRAKILDLFELLMSNSLIP